ncbi:unnamed protein product [Caenorhabditis nigoni]
MVFFSTTEESNKLEALKTDPCPTEEFFKFPVLFFISDPEIQQYFLKFWLPGVGFQWLGNLGFHVASTVYYLFFSSPKTTISSGTRRAQRVFFIGIIVQTSIPVLILLVPAAGLVFQVFTNNYRQEFMNLNIIICGLNGLAESLAILLIHHPFRIAVKKMLGLGRSSESKTQTMPVNKCCARKSSSFGRILV